MAISLFLLCNSPGRGQMAEADRSLVRALTHWGIENVRISIPAANVIRVGYENRTFRSELYAAGIVSALAAQYYPGPTTLRLIVSADAVPILALEFELAAYRLFLADSMTEQEFANTLVFSEAESADKFRAGSDRINSSFFKLDVAVSPGLAVQLGNMDDFFKWSGSLLFDTHMVLWPGFSWQMRTVLPLVNELRQYSDEVRISRFGLHQVLSDQQGTFLSLSAGQFEPDRWGLAGEIGRFFHQRQFLLGAGVEYTGFLLYQHKRWHYSKLNVLTCRGYGQYQFRPIDLSLAIAYEKFLQGDHGWRLDINRVFGESAIGFYGAVTDKDKFGGVKMKIPMLPQKRSPPKRLRVVPGDCFMLDYRSTSEAHTFGKVTETGVRISTGADIGHYINNMVPSYIRNNIAVWKQAANQVRLRPVRSKSEENSEKFKLNKPMDTIN